MLIYGAFRPHVRTLVLAVAWLSKGIFIALVLIYGPQYLDKVGIAVVVDCVIIVLFVTYLLVSGRADPAA